MDDFINKYTASTPAATTTAAATTTIAATAATAASSLTKLFLLAGIVVWIALGVVLIVIVLFCFRNWRRLQAKKGNSTL